MHSSSNNLHVNLISTHINKIHSGYNQKSTKAFSGSIYEDCQYDLTQRKQQDFDASISKRCTTPVNDHISRVGSLQLTTKSGDMEVRNLLDRIVVQTREVHTMFLSLLFRSHPPNQIINWWQHGRSGTFDLPISHIEFKLILDEIINFLRSPSPRREETMLSKNMASGISGIRYVNSMREVLVRRGSE